MREGENDRPSHTAPLHTKLVPSSEHLLPLRQVGRRRMNERLEKNVKERLNSSNKMR